MSEIPTNPFVFNSKRSIKEQGREVLTHRTASNRNQHNGGARMAVKPNMGIPPSKSISEWKSIGSLAAELVEKAKAGGK